MNHCDTTALRDILKVIGLSAPESASAPQMFGAILAWVETNATRGVAPSELPDMSKGYMTMLMLINEHDKIRAAQNWIDNLESRARRTDYDTRDDGPLSDGR
jgi:hypothetical protein